MNSFWNTFRRVRTHLAETKGNDSGAVALQAIIITGVLVAVAGATGAIMFGFANRAAESADQAIQGADVTSVAIATVTS